MKYLIDKKIRVGYLAAFLLLLLSYLLLFITTNQILKETKWINHTYTVIDNLEKLVSEIKDVETGFRGYLIMKDEIFLEPYNTSLPRVDSITKKIYTLTISDEFQQKKLDTLNRLINEKLNIMRNALGIFALSKNNITDSLKLTAYPGKRVMDSIRSMVSNMEAYENTLMNKRIKDLSNYHNLLNAINISSLVIAILLSIYSLITYTTENKSRREADEKTLLYRQQLEERIEELNIANKELTQLRHMEKFAITGRISRTIAHEVRNPLTNINLATEQLKDIVLQNEENQLLLNIIKRNANRINQLVSDLLNATKYSELQLTQISINKLVNEALDMAKDRIELYNIKVEKKFAEGLCNIEVDAEKIKIAVLNIIVNAIEATQPSKGILTVETTNKNDKCIIIITDNGVGMNKEFLLKLFDPFFTNKENGTGLGLTNTQNIILTHKGDISVDSEPGKGTSFTISLDFTNNNT